MCRALGVSKSGYYRWASGAESDHDRRDAELTAMIEDYFGKQRGRVGSRAIYAWLARQGQVTSVRRVWRLMASAGLVCCHPRPRKRTTIPDTDAPRVPDRLRRDFNASRPNEKWVGDISAIRVGAGWAYLATVIDLYGRKIVGYAIADHMRESLVTLALSNALQYRDWPQNVIFHSDRGAQYTSKAFAQFCDDHNVLRSMGRVGSCYDNAAAESFFATIKKELIYRKPWLRISQLRKAVFGYIEIYYNRNRLHSANGYLTPDEYEIEYKSNQLNAA